MQTEYFRPTTITLE